MSGAAVERNIIMGPVAGTAMNITVMSHCGQLDIGFFMDPAAIGLGSVFLHLKAELNWHSLFHDMIGRFDVDELEKRQAKALKKAGIERPD
jgi:hypothetical protein